MSFMSDDSGFDELDSVTLQALEAAEASVKAKPAPAPYNAPPKPTVTNKAALDRAARLARIERELNNTASASTAAPSAPLSFAKPSGTAKFRPVKQPGGTPTTVIDLDDGDDPILDFDPPTQPASYNAPPSPPQRAPLASASTSSTRPSTSKAVVIDVDEFTEDEDDFLLDESALRQIDLATAAGLAGKPFVPTNLLTRQTTLTGEIIAAPPASRSFTRTKSGNNATKTSKPKEKVWNHATAAARTIGGQKPDTKGKGRAEAPEELEEEEAPPPPVPGIRPPPMHLRADMIAAKEWIFPLNHQKRDYQYNIVRRALFENTLVALPTGLGKTFVAGCVMLNYYRWFPKGKIVFLAPTKPLVAQQIEASHKTCGIPGDDAAELTGMTQFTKRAELWKTKRVFYLTPQTFVNDLRKIPELASQVVLVVVDEAHRATGAYSYSLAVRDMMVMNPHFRVLALTATPGSNREAVQAVVDNMHISHIEIRDENALDLREYVHRKHLLQHVVEAPPHIVQIGDTIVKLMEKIGATVGQFIPGANMRTMGEFRTTAAMRNLGPSDKWAFSPLSNLGSLCRALNYLNTESYEMCYETLSILEHGGTDEKGKKKYQQKNLVSDPLFKSIMENLNKLKRGSNGALMVHHKMDRLRALLLQYFSDQHTGENARDPSEPIKESKVMVFASYRKAVEQIVEVLNLDAPIVRAHRFIGQAASKEGIKGLTQKDQLKVIEEFKKGTFNTLVCTSIGEEGLDIGEVDYIVCYDSHKAPIKMLQRIGRTGRKKDGHIAVLVAEGKEEDNFEKAKVAYADVQRSITRGDQVELYTDVPRLIPVDIQPVPREMVMPIIAYNKDSIGKSSKAVGSIEKYVTKTRAPKEPKLTAKARKQLLAEAKALADADSDDSADLHFSQVTKGKAKAKSTKKPKAKGAVLARSPSDSDDAPPEKPKRKAKRKPDASASDDDPPTEKPQAKNKKRKADVPADYASDDSAPVVKKKKTKEKRVKKKRARDDDDESSSDDSPAPKKKKRRSSSTMDPTSSSTKSPVPSPFPKTFGFVTGAGKQLAIPTRPLTPPIDISDDEPAMSDHDVEMAVNPTHSASSSGDEMNIRAGDVSLDRPLFLSTQSSPIAPIAAKFTKFATKPSKPSVSPEQRKPTPKSSPTHEITYEDFAAEADIPASQKRIPQYSPDWDISQLIPSTNVAGPSRSSGSHDWLLDSDSDDEVLISKPSAKPVSQAYKPTAKGKERARDSLGSHAAASPTLKRTQARPSNKQPSFTEKLITTMGPPRGVIKPARHAVDADSSIELISSSTRERPHADRAGPSKPSRHEEDSFMDDSFARYVQPTSATSPHSSPIRRPKGIKRGRKPAEPALGDPLSSDEDDAAGRRPLSVLDISDDSPYVARKRKPATKVKTRKRPVFDRNNAFVAMEADLSGEDDVNVGSTDTEEDENEYDKEFIADGDITQDSGYDQSAIYRQGLMTQAPAGLNFASKPVRAGVFGAALGRIARPAAHSSSSPPRAPNSEDDYEFGSFIVEDEDEEDV